MRLIDADEFKRQIAGMAIINNFPTDKANAMCELIDSQHTAYDADKVVEQLEALKENYRKTRENTYCRSTETDDCDSCRADHYLEARLGTIDRVIDIVKCGVM